MKRTFFKKFLLYSIAFILYALTAATYVHAASIFLTDLGPDFLPYQFIVVSLLIIVNSFLSSYASMRMASNKLFSGTLLFFILNYIVLMFLSPGSFEHTFYFMVIANFMFFLEEITIIYFLSSLMTPLQAKSMLPTVFSYTNLGVIVGSLLAAPYTKLHEHFGIGSIPIAVLLFMIAIVFLVSKIFKREIALNFSNVQKMPLFKSIKKSLRYVYNDSHLFKWLALVIFLVVGLQLTVEFKLKTVLAHSFSHDRLTEVLGLAFAAKSAVVLLFSTFASKKLLFKFGVSNMLMFYPVSVLIAVLVAIAFQLNYLAVILLFIVFSSSHYANYGITTSQILSIVPKNIHQSVHFLLKGLFYAASLLFFSLTLLFYSYDISLETTLNTAVIIYICIALIYAVHKVKNHYYKELKRNLYKNDLYLKLRSIDLLAEKISIKRGEGHLRRVLVMPNVDRDVQSRVIASLGVIGNYQTVVDLARILTSDANPKTKTEAIHAINSIIKSKIDLSKYPVTKHYLLRAYENILLSGAPSYLKSEAIAALKYFDLEDVIQFLEDHLLSEDTHIVQNTIKTFSEFKDRGIIPYLEPFLDNKSMTLLGEAIVSLWQFEEMRIKLMPKLAELLQKKTKDCVKNGLYIIGSIKAKWEKDYVEKQLKKRDSHIKNSALITLIRLKDYKHIDELVKKMVTLAKKENHAELEFIFSWYRLFDDQIKKLIIQNIQHLKGTDAAYVLEAFKKSKYVFSNEIMDLS